MENQFKSTQKPSGIHRIKFDNRSEGFLSGIVDVVSFDDEEIVFESSYGGIILKGSNLHIKSLNLENGEVTIDGNVDSINYTKSQGRNKEPLLKKLFR